MLDRKQVVALRLERQGLVEPARDEAGYLALFRRLQPVAPAYFSMPGSPPRLRDRAGNDAALADALRGCREVVKGRFRTGQIGYVLARDLEVYGTAFRRPLARSGPIRAWQRARACATTGRCMSCTGPTPWWCP